MLELVEAGVIVTAIGMGVVFILLSLLVGIIHAMSSLSRLIEGPALARAEAGQAVDEELVGVIGAAISIYRSKRES